jgi:hypothetical protein
MKKILTLLIITFLQSCIGDGYQIDRDFRLNVKQFDQNKSIIITKTNVTQKSFDEKVLNTGFTEMNWCKYDEKIKCKEVFYLSPYTQKKFDDHYHYYLTNAGMYYLDEVKELRNHPEYLIILPAFVLIGGGGGTPFGPNFNTSKSGWDKKLNAPNFASFEAKPNEIVYIGDLFFTFVHQKYWVKGKINLEVEDNYDEAVKYFHSQHPEYKDKPVVKRLVKPGVLLDNYDAGIFW